MRAATCRGCSLLTALVALVHMSQIITGSAFLFVAYANSNFNKRGLRRDTNY